MSAPSLILASASPRRQSLLCEAGYEFTVQPANIPEDDAPPGLRPSDLARFLALEKASNIAEQFPDDVVLGADTVVAFGETVLGKPEDTQDARRMLNLLSGTTHIVITAIAVICRSAGFSQTDKSLSAVHMRPLTRDELVLYIDSGQWEGKAGGYGIQDPDPFVTRMAGSHTNIVGLPMEVTAELLLKAGIVPNRK